MVWLIKSFTYGMILDPLHGRFFVNKVKFVVQFTGLVFKRLIMPSRVRLTNNVPVQSTITRWVPSNYLLACVGVVLGKLKVCVGIVKCYTVLYPAILC